MSILINGMEMPTSCANCEWSMLCKMDLGMSCYCSIVKKTEDIDIARKGRMSSCPLVEVPPHGRLIDADALDDAFTELRWDDEGLAHWGDRNEWCLSGNEVEELFNNAPTVIPADKDGGT